jgi:hypothetical protein
MESRKEMKKLGISLIVFAWVIVICATVKVMANDLSGQIYPVDKVSLEQDAYFKTIKKIKELESDNKVYYDKVQPIKEQYCFVKVQIKEVNNEIVKQEIVECADGRKAYDGPSYWELFAQFYYRDMNTPAYCRRYERPSHAYNIPGKVCLDKNGNWEVKK